jgi:hypothetical protein
MNQFDTPNPNEDWRVPERVILDAIENMFFLVILAGGVFVVSKFSRLLGIIPFWIIAAIVAVTVVQYIATWIAFLFFFIKSVVTGFRGNWEPCRSSIPLLVGTAFKVAESAVALYLMWRLWLHFYR